MKYGTFKYRTTILYGETISTYISPNSGPNTGGQEFILSGNDLNPTSFDDEFSSPSLDVTKWVDVSAGSGSISTGSSHLVLDTGSTASSVAGIKSVRDNNDIQAEIKASIPSFTVFPAGDVIPLALELRIDTNNYCRMYVSLGLSGKMYLKCEVARSGVITDSFSTSWRSGTYLFKILRLGGQILFIANNVVIYSSMKFYNDSASFYIYSSNESQAYQIDNVVVEHFYFMPYLVFGTQIVHNPVIVSNRRLRGTTPPSITDKGHPTGYAGPVDLKIVTLATRTITNGYSYYYVDTFRVVNSEKNKIKMSITNDRQLFSPTNAKVGLGDGV